MIQSFLRVMPSIGRGRGVFTTRAIPSGRVIEIAPVLVLSAEDTKRIDGTRLHNYIFLWGRALDRSCIALGYCSLYNHSFHPNCEYQMDFLHQTMSVITLDAVRKGEELFINYNGDIFNQSPMWFPIKKK